MTPKIVVVGSCMIDFTCCAPRLPKPGETIRGTRFEKKYGGKGANQCVTASKLGANTTLIASLGNDVYAHEYLAVLKNERVDTSYVQLQKDKESGTAHITVAENGENSIVIVPGANDSLSLKQAEANVLRSIANATVLLCTFETPLETTLDALKLHQGQGGLSIVNGAPAVENLDPEILKLCDIFCLNETEAEIMTGIQPLKLSNIQKAVDVLLDKGCKTIILTLGEQGAVYASTSQKTIVHIPTVQVRPVDTTGAGDAFVGALAYFKAHHPNLAMEECIRRACIVATESVLAFGTHASFPKRESLDPNLFL
ncbi:hypothetical protein KM043_007379 [Ampulex compressa]|nr:hypothetical protein KM043_007379 [Ampulex compressa]